MTDALEKAVELLLEHAIHMEGGIYNEYRITAEDYDAVHAILFPEDETTE